MQTRLA